jgi:hypothetical protein
MAESQATLDRGYGKPHQAQSIDVNITEGPMRYVEVRHKAESVGRENSSNLDLADYPGFSRFRAAVIVLSSPSCGASWIASLEPAIGQSHADEPYALASSYNAPASTAYGDCS